MLFYVIAVRVDTYNTWSVGEQAARNEMDQSGTPEEIGKVTGLTVWIRHGSYNSRHPLVYLRGRTISWDSSPCTVDMQGIMETCLEMRLPLEEQYLYRGPQEICLWFSGWACQLLWSCSREGTEK